MNLTFFSTREKKNPCVKIINNFSFPSREKKKKHSWKNPKKCPWKLSTAGEKLEKSVHESNFPSGKKVEKRPKKKAFTGTFDFHRKKKTLNRGGGLTMFFLGAWNAKSLAWKILDFCQCNEPMPVRKHEKSFKNPRENHFMPVKFFANHAREKKNDGSEKKN